jgi:hypothetical protein
MSESTFECCICMENISNNQNKVITKCKHTFCLTCLLQHYDEKNNCPLCREKLISDDDGNQRNYKVKININQLSSIHDPDSALDYQIECILLPQILEIFGNIRENIEQRREQVRTQILSRINVNDQVQDNVHIPPQRTRERQRRRRQDQERSTRQPRCSLCSQTGHNRRTCPSRLNRVF